MIRRKTAVRILSVLLTLILLVGLMPFSAFAAEVEEPEIEAVEAAAVPEIEEAAPVEEEALPEAAVEAEALPEAAVEAEALPEPAAEAEDEGGESYTVRYLTYNGSPFSTQPNYGVYTHEAGQTVYVSEYNKTTSRSASSLKNNEKYRYIFDGWSLTQGNVNDPANTVYPRDYAMDGSFEMPAHDVSLYAHYEVIEYYHWELTVGPNGTVSHERHAGNEGSDGIIELSNASELYKVFTTGSTSSGYTVVGTVYSSFVPQATEDSIFDGWYCNGEKLNLETLYAKDFPVLTAAMYNAGQNKIEARFMENDGSYVPVKYQRDNGDGTYVVYYQQMRQKGTAMPTVADPTWDNHYFLGWDQIVPAVVPDEGITLTAQWLEGPTIGNTANDLYTVHCVDGGHEDIAQGISWGTSQGNITYDDARGKFLCSITLERIGTFLGVGPASYDVITGQEHFAEHAWPDSPVIHLVWDDNQWVGDGAQIVNVYHHKELTQDDLNDMAPFICVKDIGSNDSLSLSLLEGTYTIEYDYSNNPNSATATATITDFAPYAKQLGEYYVPVFDKDLHEQQDYIFHFILSSKTKYPADHNYSYKAWKEWDYENNIPNPTPEESSSGMMTLMAKDTTPTYTINYTDPMGLLKSQEYTNVPLGSSIPPYVFPDDLSEVANGAPVKIGDSWYTFCGWATDATGYNPFRPVADQNYNFTAVWEEVVTITFTDGMNGAAFEDVVYFVTDGSLPYDDDTLFERLGELEGMQLENGRFLDGWDQDPFDLESLYESHVITAVWDRYIEVIYRDGVEDEELFEDYSTDYLESEIVFPEFDLGDGSSEPVREGYRFAGWESVVDAEEGNWFEDNEIDEEITYIVNSVWDEDEQFWHVWIVLEAQWTKDGEEPLDIKISHSCAFGNNLSIGYLIKVSDLEGYSNLKLDVSGKELTSYDTVVSGGVSYYRFVYTGIHAKAMCDMLTAVLYADKDGVTLQSEPDEYSIKTYAYNRLQESTDTAFKRLLVDMLNYGAAAQVYFRYETDSLVNAELTAEQKAYGTAEVPTLTPVNTSETLSDATASFYGKNVGFHNGIDLRFYMQFADGQATENVKLVISYTSADGNVITKTIPYSDFGDYNAMTKYGTISSIYAKDIDAVVTAVIYDGETQISDTIRYSIETYAYNKLNSSTTDGILKDLVAELMKYGKAAKAYFGQ